MPPHAPHARTHARMHARRDCARGRVLRERAAHHGEALHARREALHWLGPLAVRTRTPAPLLSCPCAVVACQGVIRARFDERYDNWRVCYKALLLAEYLIRRGPMVSASSHRQLHDEAQHDGCSVLV